MKKAWLMTLLIAMSSMFYACGVKEDENSGIDKDRGGAIEVSIGQVVNDDLNPDAGDHTDWKTFAVPAPGYLTVQVFWDQSADIKDAVITVHDKFGSQLEKRNHQADIPNDEVVVRVEEGYYFVKLRAERGASIYSLVGRHSIGDDSEGGNGGVVRPEFAGSVSFEPAAEETAEAGGGAAAAGGGAAPAAGGGSAPAAAGGGAALPTAAAGGAALPTAAAGGAAAPVAAETGATPVALPAPVTHTKPVAVAVNSTPTPTPKNNEKKK